MPRRTRYQQGSVQREKRQSGADVWVFRWWESTFDGTSKRRKAIVGTVEAFPTEASALKAAKALRIDANQQTPHSEGGPETVAELVAHYRLKELVGENQGRKSFSTRAGYESYLNGWILPRWGDHRLDHVKSVAVEEWLDSIKRAKGTRAKIRNIMSAIFHHAMRYEWVERNPIKLVRQSAKRERTPDILELAELQLLLSKLSVRERTLALLDAATGLRVSELLALRWCDVDFENLELRVTRSIWHQVLGNCKTEASAKPVPMDSYMAEDLLRWRRQSVYASDDHYVFASETMKGKAALLAGQPHEAAHSASCESNWHSQENRMAHFPALLRHIAEGKRRGCQNRSGALATREQSDHAGCLHTGSELEQACSTEQGCKNDGVKRGSEGRRKIPANSAVAGLLDLYRTLI